MVSLIIAQSKYSGIIESMEPQFDPTRYRHDLARRLKDTLSPPAQEMDQAGDTYDSVSRDKFYTARQELKLARWTEQYQRAKLLKRGHYTSGEQGDIIDTETGLTPQQLADYERLFDALRLNIDDLLAIIDQHSIPIAYLRSHKAIKCAEKLFESEINYGQGLTPANAETMKRFSALFGLEDLLKRTAMQYISYAIKTGNRAAAETILDAYPLFNAAEVEEVRAQFTANYYPIPEGLRDQVPAKELFGQALEHADTEPTIPLDQVASLLQSKAALLAQDFAIHPYFYWALRGCMSNGDQERRAGKWTVRRNDEFGRRLGLEDRNYVRALFFLDERTTAVHGSTSRSRIELHFSTDPDKAREENDVVQMFTTTKHYRFEGMYLGDQPYRDGNVVRVDTPDADLSILQGVVAKKSALVEFAADLLEHPKRDFTDSLQTLQELARQFDLPANEIEKLMTAINEFGTYMYAAERSHVGDCLTVPNRFNHFLGKKFGIKLAEARYGEYHPEWGKDMGYDPFTFFHAISVYGKRVVIDWTATQYADRADKPMPYIYEVGKERERFGPLYKRFGDDPNELLINDPNDPSYIAEPPVKYEAA